MNKILLIEDNAEIRENMAEILELSNYKVYTAEDGKKGVELALEQKPDLILCDIMMPVLDGYAVLHMLHKNPAMRQIPFIFLSAKAERSDIRKGMELGADDYITKPFDGTELLNAIEGRLRKAVELRRELSADIQGVDTLISLSGGEDVLAAFREGRSVNRYKKKQVIYAEGNHPVQLFYIQKGKVKTYRRNDDGKELIVGLYNEGDFVGYTALLEGGVYREHAEALEDSELALIPRSEFEALIGSNPVVMQKFIRMLARNILEKEDQLLGIAYNSLRKKVAEALLALYNKYNTDNLNSFTIDISRENLASVAGVAKESLIRTIGDFRDEKLITLEEGRIRIVELQKLRNLVN